MSRSHQHPILCRICEFPAADSGVRVDAINAEKLSEWCRRKLISEFQTNTGSQDAARTVICQFCIWLARLDHERSDGKISGTATGSDWWTGHDNDPLFYTYFYKKLLIQPCRVVLNRIVNDFDHVLPKIASNTLIVQPLMCKSCSTHFTSASELKTHTLHDCLKQTDDQQCAISKSGKHNKRYIKIPCNMCGELVSKNHMDRHLTVHKPFFVRCKIKSCITYFHSEDERRQHELQIHIGGECGDKKKCIYCGSLHSSNRSLVAHMQTMHSNEFIRCNYHFRRACLEFFRTNSEKEEHFRRVHTDIICEVQCVYCGKLCRGQKLLNKHICTHHAAVSIRCNAYHCKLYFLSQFDCDEHFRLVHEKPVRFRCTACNCRFKERRKLRHHVSRKHNDNCNVQCAECNEVFQSKMKLIGHIRVMHCHNRHQKVPCAHCGKLMLKKSMRRHCKVSYCAKCNIKLPCKIFIMTHSKLCANANDPK